MIIRWITVNISYRYLGNRVITSRNLSTASNVKKCLSQVELLGQKYMTDDWTNVTPKIISYLGRNLHVTRNHPLSHVRQQIVNYFYKSFLNRLGNPIFSVYDNLRPIVTVEQNFDSLLVPKDHVSRSKNDCYYVNRETLLRSHTTAHQSELISSGLNNFLVIGDVYRRDEIDVTHYPVFHQVDAVRLCTVGEIFKNVKDSTGLELFEHKGIENDDKQGCHSLEAVKLMEHELKSILVGLARCMFGKDIQYRWAAEYFPFTHPSWELEVYFGDKWVEVLGCGIIRQEILQRSGVQDRMGWAFGLGLERLAMCLYGIPDIRLFWSTDSGFLNQFNFDDPNTRIQYKPVSIYPQCKFDMSFWLPQDGHYTHTDFYDIVREIGGDIIEQISLIDQFTHPKTKKTSHCYRIVYRHMERTLTKEEVNDIHKNIEKTVVSQLNVVMRS